MCTYVNTNNRNPTGNQLQQDSAGVRIRRKILYKLIFSLVISYQLAVIFVVGIFWEEVFVLIDDAKGPCYIVSPDSQGYGEEDRVVNGDPLPVLQPNRRVKPLENWNPAACSNEV